MKKLVLLVSLIWACSLAAVFGLTVPASEDTTGLQTRITVAASNASTLTVDAIRRSYVYFNLDKVPHDAIVRFAHLRIYIPSVRQKGAGATVHKVLGQWNESIAGAEPEHDPTPIAAFGAESIGSRRFVTVDITSVVQEWISGATDNEGVVIKAANPTTQGGATASFTLSSKDGAVMGMPAHLDIELLDELPEGDSLDTVLNSTVNFAQLSQDVRDLLTPGFKPTVVLDESSAGRKLQFEAFGVVGAKGMNFQWYRDGSALDLGQASTVNGNVVVVDTALLGSGSYALLASNGPATVLSAPFSVSNTAVDLSQGLLLYLPFDGDAKDKSGQSNHGVVDGAKLTKDRFGSSDSAYFFNGASKIKIEHKASLNGSPMTVSCWFQSTDPNPGHMVEKYENATWSGWGLAVEDLENPAKTSTRAAVNGFFLRSRQNYLIGGYDNQPLFGGGGPLNDGIWHQATMVVDGAFGKLFVDGQLVDTHPWVGPAGAVNATWPLYIGHRPRNFASMGNFNPDFKGSIDDVRLYNRALSNAEVLELFNLEKPLPLSDAEFAEIKFDGPVFLGAPEYAEVGVLLDDYLIAKDEMTYAKWNTVVDAAKTKLGWTLPKGVIGSGYGSETVNHPVTGISATEIALWCNAASILNKLDPCYFVFNSEGQRIVLKPETAEFADVRGIEWDKNAGGYRLPTGDEWEVAARGGLRSKLYPWGDEAPSKLNSNWIFASEYPRATSAVGSYPRNAYGLSDCAGNIFEMTWDTSLAPGGEVPSVIKVNVITRGGAWNQGYAPKVSGLGWAISISWERSQVNGFRLARSLPKNFVMIEIPAQDSVPLGFPSSSPEVPVSVPKYRIAADETTFGKWSAVVKAAKETLGWTLAVGVQGSGAPELTSHHPVTGVTFQEVVLWCNAASKLDGLEPVYSTFDGTGAKVPLTPDTQTFVNDRGVHWDKTANGYRLPTGDEWEVAARGGLKSRTYPWGDDAPSPKNANWVFASGYPNATTPVGTYARNGYGLSDCAGNAFEMTWDTSLLPGSSVPDVIKDNAIVRGGAWNQGYLPKVSGYGWDLPISWDKRTEYGFRIAQNAAFSKYVSSGFSLISGGSFKMGGKNLDSDLPAVTDVYVKPFHASQTEVTFADWNRVKAWAERNGYQFTAGSVGNPSGKGPDHPVAGLTWYSAVKWCNALSEMDGRVPVYYLNAGRLTSDVYRNGPDLDLQEANFDTTANGYRLPTQAEWEKAARGGLEGKRFPWGDTISPDQDNYYASKTQDYDLSPFVGVAPEFMQGGSPYTNPVKRFAPNGFGLYGMAGNLNEWCWDPMYEPNGGYYKYFIRASRGGAAHDGHYISDASKARVAFVDFKYASTMHGGGFPSFRLVLNAVGATP